jgi:hypothetical protein
VDVAHVAVALLQHLVDVADVSQQVLLDPIYRLHVAPYPQRNQPYQFFGTLLEVEPNTIVTVLQDFLLQFMRGLSFGAQLLFFAFIHSSNHNIMAGTGRIGKG